MHAPYHSFDAVNYDQCKGRGVPAPQQVQIRPWTCMSYRIPLSDQPEMKLVGCCRLRFVAESRETVLQSAETDPEYRGGAPAVAVHVLEGKFDIGFV